MLLLMACLAGFVLGVVVRRWWVVAAAVPVGIVTYWTTPSRHWKEDNLAGFVRFMAFCPRRGKHRVGTSRGSLAASRVHAELRACLRQRAYVCSSRQTCHMAKPLSPSTRM